MLCRTSCQDRSSDEKAVLDLMHRCTSTRNRRRPIQSASGVPTFQSRWTLLVFSLHGQVRDFEHARAGRVSLLCGTPSLAFPASVDCMAEKAFGLHYE